MRLALTLACLAAPLHAWEFTADPVCTLHHDTGAATLTVTHDPRQAQPYKLTATHPTGWPDTPVFSMRFDGPRGLTISTTRHTITDQTRALTVTDTGFGNVLNGLEFNATATLLTGDRETAIPLTGAAQEVRKFRNCLEGGLA